MAAKGEDDGRRGRLANARRFLPSVAALDSRERSRRLAKHLGVGIRCATRIRIDLEREAKAAALAAAESGAPTPADFWKTHDDALVELIVKARELYERAVRLRQLNAAASALKQLHVFSQDRASWNGARPLASEDDGTGEVHLHLHLGPEDDNDVEEPAS